MRLDIKRGNTVIANVYPEGESKMRYMGDETLTMRFSLPTMVQFAINDTVAFDGFLWRLNVEPNVEKLHSRMFNYTLKFEGIKYDLIDVALLFPDANNDLAKGGERVYVNASELVDHIVRNANRVGAGWSKGTVDATDFVYLDFDNHNCLSGLSYAAEEFGLNYLVDANKAIHLTKGVTASGLTLQYGKNKGLVKVERRVVDSNIVTRLYAFGSAENLPADYPYERLRMNVPYLEKNVATYGVKEGIITFDDVRPERTGSVTWADAADPLKFADSTMDFDLNAALIPNVAARLTFNSGQLMGFEFEISNYDAATKGFTLIKNVDERAMEVPGNLLKPAVGDKYVITYIYLPAEYIAAAKTRLTNKAQTHLNLNSSPKHKYSVDIDPLYLAQLAVNIKLGHSVRFVDADFGLDKDYHVTEITKDIQNPYDVVFDLASEVSQSTIVRDYIAEEKQAAKIELNQRWNAEEARRSVLFTRELQDMVFDQDGYFDPVKIKPLSIETWMLTVGNLNHQFQLQNLVMQIVSNNTAVTNSAGTFIHLNLEAAPRTWNILANTSINLDTTAYYIYVKAERVGTNASLLITHSQIKVDQDVNLWHFLIGMLSSVVDGYRRIKTTTGYTSVNGGELTTGKIVKPSTGATLLDIDEGKFYGPVVFSSGQDAEAGYLQNITNISNAQSSANAANTVAGNAQSVAIEANTKIDNLDVAAINLLRNTGFLGDFAFTQLDPNVPLESFTNMYNEPLIHWTLSGGSTGTVVNEAASKSGKALSLNGTITQTIPPVTGEVIISLWAKGGSTLNVAFGASHSLVLSASYTKHVIKATVSGATTFSIAGTATIYGVMLAEGNAETEWFLHPYDASMWQGKLIELQYLAKAMKSGSTSVIGGLILSNLIEVGNYLNGVMQAVTAGMSGIYSDANSPAFWGGGTLAQAAAAIANPSNPAGAKFAVSHGGKIVAMDAIIRGVIEATDGSFKGTVRATDGEFLGQIKSAKGKIGLFDILADGLSSENFVVNKSPIQPISEWIETITYITLGANASKTGSAANFVWLECSVSGVALSGQSKVEFSTITGAEMGSAVVENRVEIANAANEVVYYKDFTVVHSVSLSAGTYTIKHRAKFQINELNLNGMASGSISIVGPGTNGAIKISPQSALIHQGSDGFFARYSLTFYLFFKNTYGFEVRTGDSGIRSLLSAGLQKYSGGSWVAL